MATRVTRHDRCPACSKIGRDRKGDNLAVYADGGEYCFSCGYTKPSGNRKYLQKALEQPTTALNKETDIYPLPEDVTPLFPPKVLKWLNQYELGWPDIVENNLLWSEREQRLIFPFDGGWQGRSFEDVSKKWFSQGKLEQILFFKNIKYEEPIILVEDIISCIKVGKLYPCVCLFGSHCSPTRYSQLSYFSNSVVFWLDYDKRSSAVAQAVRARTLGFEAKTLVTGQDPKEYSLAEIKELVEST